MNSNIFIQENFNDAFNKANLTTHLVETEWHCPIFKKYNWVPETECAEGFVRSYTYFHSKLNKRITFTTGYYCDYFEDNGVTIHATLLENHLINLNKNLQNK